MRYLIILLILFLFSDITFASEINGIEEIIKIEFPEYVTLTKVPRGIIISIDESMLFDRCGTEIKPESHYILDKISKIINQIKNICVIENHTLDECGNNIESWETAMVRAGNITDYMIKNNSVNPEQLFNIGYGEHMPFNESVNPDAKKLFNRIDFVILSYEAVR
jgi:flagellar motor protein MotB